VKERNFKEERQALGFTVAEIAPLLGVSPRTIPNWEQGINPPKRSVWIMMDVLKSKKKSKKK
jgi:DNA-binding transcriptional regulator YiaG